MAKNDKPKSTKVRVLTTIHVDGAPVAADSVVELPADTFDYYVAAGVVDPHPDAIKHAEKLAADDALEA